MPAAVKKSLIHILNIEDETTIQIVTKLALESDGFVVESCGSGNEAIEKVATFTPDLILLDVLLPDTDGPTLLETLRQIPKLAATPVIFMTALVQNHEIAHYKAIGAVDVIVKPFDPMGLAARVRKLWELRHG